MKTIVCFGDSNTYGTPASPVPDSWSRFGPDERWPGVMRAALGPGFTVIEEALPGRTTVHDDPIEGRHKNGLSALRGCLESHLPLDLVVLMLGTNDLKARFSVTPTDIATSVGVLLDEILARTAGPGGTSPRLLLVAPVPVEEIGFLGGLFVGASGKSRALAPLYQAAAARRGATFLDAGASVQVSPVDGIHFEADQHRALAGAVSRAIFGLDFPTA